jgi:5-methylcytosine-specific restriction endonuclease McrA
VEPLGLLHLRSPAEHCWLCFLVCVAGVLAELNKGFPQFANPQDFRRDLVMPMIERRCRCGKLFLTTRPAGYSCPECRNRRTKERGKYQRKLRELMMRGSHTESEWLFQIARQMDLCFYCSTSLRDEHGRWRGTRDHLTPLAKGGTDYIENIVAACGACNSKKGNRTLGEYRDYLNRQAACISKVSELPTYKNLPIFTEEWPRVAVLNPEIQEPFSKFLAQQEAASLAFKGIHVTERRKEIQRQKIEANRRLRA